MWKNTTEDWKTVLFQDENHTMLAEADRYEEMRYQHLYYMWYMTWDEISTSILYTDGDGVRIWDLYIYTESNIFLSYSAILRKPCSKVNHNLSILLIKSQRTK